MPYSTNQCPTEGQRSRQAVRQCLTNLDKRCCSGMIRRGSYDRFSQIAALTDFGENGDFAQKGHLLADRLATAATVTEYLDAFAVGRGEIAHVFDDAENRHVDFVKH